MGFETVVVNDVKIEKPTVPAGTYVFQLLPGAGERINKFNGITELNLSAAVAEGDEQGKRVFWTYPDPTSVSKKSGKVNDWSAQAMKKLQLVLGIDAYGGETFTQYFARVGAENAPRFSATMAAGNYETKDGSEPRVQFNVFSVKPAA
jgi:hypothetical protein